MLNSDFNQWRQKFQLFNNKQFAITGDQWAFVTAKVPQCFCFFGFFRFFLIKLTSDPHCIGHCRSKTKHHSAAPSCAAWVLAKKRINGRDEHTQTYYWWHLPFPSYGYKSLLSTSSSFWQQIRRVLNFFFFSRKVIGGSDKRQSVGHVAPGGILTNFSSTVISCVSCPGFSASLDVDVLADLKTIR